MCAVQFDPVELRRGAEHELEHTNDLCIAQEIAMDHLAEDPAYYQKLALLEGREDRSIGPALEPEVPSLEEADTERPIDPDEPIPPTLAVPYTANPSSREQLLHQWRRLVNMSGTEIERFRTSPEGKSAGMSRAEARSAGVGSGQDSARALVRMKAQRPEDWSRGDWGWAKRQVAFIQRMRAAPGPLRKEGRPTRKLLALKLWGHDPERSFSRNADMSAMYRRGTWPEFEGWDAYDTARDRWGDAYEMRYEHSGPYVSVDVNLDGSWRSGDDQGSWDPGRPESLGPALAGVVAREQTRLRQAGERLSRFLAGYRGWKCEYDDGSGELFCELAASDPYSDASATVWLIDASELDGDSLRSPEEAVVRFSQGTDYQGDIGLIRKTFQLRKLADLRRPLAEGERLLAEYERKQSALSPNQAARDYYVWWTELVSEQHPVEGRSAGPYERRAAQTHAERLSHQGYAAAVSFGDDPRARYFRVVDEYPAQRLAANRRGAGDYWVWTVSRRGDRPVLSEGPYGPHDLLGGKTYARIAATEGRHDRAVSRGRDPTSQSFRIVRLYQAGTGRRAV